MIEEIKNYHRYIDLMKNGFYDKLFFIDKIFTEWNTLLDYGCADGFTTKILATIFPNKRIIGYDIDEKMINIARNTGEYPGNISFTNDKNILENTDVIFLCSVVHEIFAYQTIDEVKKFWKMVFCKNRKYVIIRDMISNYNRSPIWANTQEKKVREYCNKNGINGELQRFENIYGSISRPECLLHFMMKYLYINSPNWDRELCENYMGLNNHILSHDGYVPHNFDIDYKELYILPYLKHRWKEDFGIEGELPMPLNTHGKFIFKNKEL